MVRSRQQTTVVAVFILILPAIALWTLYSERTQEMRVYFANALSPTATRCTNRSSSTPSGSQFQMKIDVLEPEIVDAFIKRGRLDAKTARKAPNNNNINSEILIIGVVTSTNIGSIDSITSFLRAYNASQVVIVGDVATDMQTMTHEAATDIYDDKRIHILGLREQYARYPDLAKALPSTGESRKNIGYVHALALGATYIWDFDRSIQDASKIPLLRKINNQKTTVLGPSLVGMMSAHEAVINPYLLYGPKEYVWPRGYPLSYTATRPFPFLSSMAATATPIPTATTKQRGRNNNNNQVAVDIVHVLPSRNADVDSVWQLQHSQVPLTWLPSRPLLGNTLVGIDPNKFSPYNAQSTLISRRAAWSLYLPHSVHARVSDVWRAYITQTILPLTNGIVAIAPPSVIQQQLQNPDSLNDGESPLHAQTTELIRFLDTYRRRLLRGYDAVTMMDDALDALIGLYATCAANSLFHDTSEVAAVVAWVKELRRLNVVEAPKVSLTNTLLTPRSNKNTDGVDTSNALVVMHLNWWHYDVVPLWRALHPEYHNVVYYCPDTFPCPSIAGIQVECLSKDVEGMFVYEGMFDAWRRHRGQYKYYLFMHDDAVVRPRFFRELFRNGTPSAPSSYPWSPDSQWSWTPQVKKSVELLQLEGVNVTCANGESVYSSMRSGQSDWYFIRDQDLGRMEALADRFRWAGLFHESAMPTLFACYIPDHHDYNLLTKWGENDRNNNTLYLEEFCAPGSPYDVTHPIKLKDRAGLESFFRARDC